MKMSVQFTVILTQGNENEDDPAVSDNLAHPFLSVSHVASGCFFTSRIFL